MVSPSPPHPQHDPQNLLRARPFHQRGKSGVVRVYQYQKPYIVVFVVDFTEDALRLADVSCGWLQSNVNSAHIVYRCFGTRGGTSSW